MEALRSRQIIPAIAGGSPVRAEFLHFAKPCLSDTEIQAVVDTLKSGWLTTAAKAKEFESTFAEYIGAKHAIAVNSCTAGLFLCLKALNIGPGDEIITTPLTFSASVNVIEHLGAKPVFADITPTSWCIDPEQISQSITKKTRAIIPVHLYGHPCDMSLINEIASTNELSVIQDCAHAIETEFNGKNVGSLPDFSCYSFYATKNVTSGEGGMIATNHSQYVDRLRMLALHGMDKAAYSRYSQGGKVGYDVTEPGFKFNMPDILAALGLEGLKLIEKRYNRRNEIWKKYQSAFNGIPGVILPGDAVTNHRHARHLFGFAINSEITGISRDDFVEAMKVENIGTGIHFHPVHLFSYYRNKYPENYGRCPIADSLANKLVSLPLTPYLSDEDVDDVINAVNKILNYFSNKK